MLKRSFYYFSLIYHCNIIECKVPEPLENCWDWFWARGVRSVGPVRFSGRFCSGLRSQEDILYHFKIGRPCPFLNGKVCPTATSEAGEIDGSVYHGLRSHWAQHQHGTSSDLEHIDMERSNDTEHIDFKHIYLGAQRRHGVQQWHGAKRHRVQRHGSKILAADILDVAATKWR
jgi:hypothetical protein